LKPASSSRPGSPTFRERFRLSSRLVGTFTQKHFSGRTHLHGSSIARTIAVALIAAPLFAGCGGRMSASQPAGAQIMPPTEIPFSERASPDVTQTVGVRLTGEKAFQSATYGRVLGYFKNRQPTTSQVVTVSANSVVFFVNVDSSLAHTASFLGNATSKQAPFPKTFDGSATASPAGTHIGTPKFSTGPLSPGKASAMYNTGAPGFYMFGCAFHYDSSGMRTVVIVK
jgi:plastocyanin